MEKIQKQEFISQIKTRFEQIKHQLSEKERRLWAASESLTIGHGGGVIVQSATGISLKTIRKGKKEIINKDPEVSERIRRPGGGRKPLIEKYPKLVKALDGLIYPFSRDEGKFPTFRWTRKSTAMLAEEINGLKLKISPKKELTVSQKTVNSIMKSLGYSMHTNKKKVSSKLNNDIGTQFYTIYEEVKKYHKSGLPVISVELMGNENLYKFSDVSEVSKNNGWVSTIIDEDTALFAVESIQKWWVEMGSVSYPNLPGLLITVDGVKNKVQTSGSLFGAKMPKALLSKGFAD